MNKNDIAIKLDLNLALVSNITLSPYFEWELETLFGNQGRTIKIHNIPFEDYKAEEYSLVIKNADVFVVLINFETLYPNFFNHITSGELSFKDVIYRTEHICSELYSYIHDINMNNSSVIWFGFEDYYHSLNFIYGDTDIFEHVVEKCNLKIVSLLKSLDVYIDLKRIIARVGIYNSFDNKGKYRWNSLYSEILIGEICKQINKQILIHKGISKKCIILDCDNVLWGGIISEDGIENVSLSSAGLGREFYEFQSFLLTLYNYGVILAICSKNDLDDVLKMFREHNEMVLNEKHIACFQVNWNDKPSNIKCISEILNISLDSMLFVDDSDMELYSVEQLLPEVKTLKYDRNTIYFGFDDFNLPKCTDIENVEKRIYTYQSNSLRQHLKASCGSYDEYLRALNMSINIHIATDLELSRISELTQRANKCTNGIRYTVGQLAAKINDGYILLSVAVSDKFCDLGLVGAIGIDGKTLDLFVLSCRALGRKIEEAMLSKIIDYKTTDFNYKTTNKNKEILSFLSGELRLNH